MCSAELSGPPMATTVSTHLPSPFATPQSNGTCASCRVMLNDGSDQEFVLLHCTGCTCDATFCGKCWVDHIVACVESGDVPRKCPQPVKGKACCVDRLELNGVLQWLEESGVITDAWRAPESAPAPASPIVAPMEAAVRRRRVSARGPKRIEEVMTSRRASGKAGSAPKKCKGCNSVLVVGAAEVQQGYA
jgi:hypothetical protein